MAERLESLASGKKSVEDHDMNNDWEHVHQNKRHRNNDSVGSSSRRLSNDLDDEWHDCLSTCSSGNYPAGKPKVSHPQECCERSTFLSLPSEIITHIFSFLSPFDLTILCRTCHILNTHASSDTLWSRHIHDNLPSHHLNTSSPFPSFQALFRAHDPHWFLPKYRIWFSDFFLTGKLIVIRYDPRRAVIEGYRLVAERPLPTFDTWTYNDEVVIHSFDPKCRLHLDEPVLQLKPQTEKWQAETPMPLHHPAQRTVFSNFLLTRPVQEMPNMALWPPPTIPSNARVRNASQQGFTGSGHKPSSRSEICDRAFRIRRWIQMANGRGRAPGVHMGEEVSTFSTLDPKLYTPTEDKPFRGIWVGDYSGHGCEFLLMHQPDDEVPFDLSSIPAKRLDESDKVYQKRVWEAKVFRGRLEAIKLTGDPNIPRGEYTFIADDIGEEGLVRVAEEAPFKGARMVKSRGHIANRMFTDDQYIPSQLLLISPNRLAQYWLDFGHISYFERVDVDSFLQPPSSNAPPSSSSQSQFGGAFED